MGPLSDAGLNMSNVTVAYDFLQDILDYDAFEPLDQAIARAFWFGIIIVITIAALVNFTQYLTLKARFVYSFSILYWLLLTQLQTSRRGGEQSAPG